MGFPAFVKAFYKVENNGNDSTGHGYNASNQGTPVYDATIKKYDNYSLKSTNTLSNFLRIDGTTLQADMKTLSSGGWTMQFWGRVDAFSSGEAIMFQKCGNVNNTGGCWLYPTNASSGYGANLISIKWNGNFDYNISGVFNSTTDLGRWYRFQFEYDIDNSRMKFYVDGVLKLTLNSVADIFENNTDNWFSIGGSGQFSWNSTRYIDNFAFATQLMNGAEVVELPSGAKTIGTFGMPKTRFKSKRLGGI